MTETRHAELKTAVKILKTSISEFARTLTKPDGTTGISHTAVIRVATGQDDTEWIGNKIDELIAKAKAENPEYFKAEINFLVS